MRLRGGVEGGHLLTARCAPRCPQVEEHGSSVVFEMVAQSKRGPVEEINREVGGNLSRQCREGTELGDGRRGRRVVAAEENHTPDHEGDRDQSKSAKGPAA